MFCLVCLFFQTLPLLIIPISSIPDKLIRDWKLLFIKGKPLYDDDNLAESISSQGSTLIDEDGNDILDNKDLEEYLVSLCSMDTDGQIQCITPVF